MKEPEEEYNLQLVKSTYNNNMVGGSLDLSHLGISSNTDRKASVAQKINEQPIESAETNKT